MQPEYVGILLNNSTYRGIPSGKTGTESIENYEDAAKSYGLIPCFFRIQDLSLDTCTAEGYIRTPSGYSLSKISIPRVIHNRAIFRNKRAHEIINLLISEGIFIYNYSTRYGKDSIHNILAKDPLISPALPQTLPANPASIRFMLEQHGDVILKPCRGSVGLGMMRLRRDKFHDHFTYSRSSPSAKGWRTQRVARGYLPLLLRKRIRSLPFLAQQRIQLAEYGGKPYDIRITVQRGLSGTWEISGMFVKTSSPRTFVSNIAQGGSAYPVHDVFSRSLPDIPTDLLIDRIAQFALQIAHSLSKHMPYAADFGMDIAVTSEGLLYFIEANGRDQRYGFKEVGLERVWKETYCKPIGFARYLLNSGSWPTY
ncbi:YheC/YheD family protein [Paenibacillus faecalis]|uniref:YheC/YheD family endospore coat-associated protein n=1 Tax=Paenibacillus faecalis TaxID=2079532 RepID=UPI000D0EAD56|nr:YheC/YheD family protein [Paenibacillus faecalis]